MTTIATDPPVSEKQRRAMFAAASGRSTLGIPKKVGEEFVGKDSPNAGKRAAGIIFTAPDGDVLVLRRSAKEKNFAGHWALPGGNVDDGETPEEGAAREAREEMGDDVPDGAREIVDRAVTPTGMVFHTYRQPVSEKFSPKLNDEHCGYAWCAPDQLPTPVHPAVKSTLDRMAGDEGLKSKQSVSYGPGKPGSKCGLCAHYIEAGGCMLVAGNIDPDYWCELFERDEALAIIRTAQDRKLSTGADEAMAMDWSRKLRELEADGVIDLYRSGDARKRLEGWGWLAFDRSSVRSYDADGRLHVARANISKAAVNPYAGREIPDHEKLGLDPDKIYKLLRDPDELRKAAPTFNNLPILSTHVPVSAKDHQPELVIGSTGTDAAFDHPFLSNSLVVWAKQGIDGIESEKQKELSSAYRYRADMTPGEYEGEKYDGVMRDIVGNHVATVEEGRAGSDVVVGDSKTEILMAKSSKLSRMAVAAGALLTLHLQPKLAQDQKLDLSPILAKVTKKNFAEQKPTIIADLKKASVGKLAQDASLDDVTDLLDKLEKVDGLDEEMATAPNSAAPPAAGNEDDEDEAMDANGAALAKIKEICAGKLSPEDMAQIEAAMSGTASDEDPELQLGGKKKDAEDEDPEKDKPEMVDKKAMDAAIKTASELAEKRGAERGAAQALKTGREIAEAARAVRPWVGELAIAQDSVRSVYEAAFKILGQKVDGVDPSAYPTILSLIPKPGERQHSTTAPSIAQDAAAAKSFEERNPHVARITVAA